MRSVGNLERFRWETTTMIKGLVRTSDLCGKAKTMKPRWQFWTCHSRRLFKLPLSQFCTKTGHLVWVCDVCVCYVTLLINTVRSCDSSHIIIWFTTGLWDQNYPTERRISQEGIRREFHKHKNLSPRGYCPVIFCLQLKTMGRNGLKPKHEGFRLNRKIRVGKHWNRSAKGIKDPISLEVFRKKIRLYLSEVAYGLNSKI